MRLVTDIYSKGSYPGNYLSNFAPWQFHIAGRSYYSMESMLQSLKTPDIRQQYLVSRMTAKEAKQWGSTCGWDGQTLYFHGHAFNRYGSEYRQLLRFAYSQLATENPDFRQALLDSAPVLRHSIGKRRQSDTILTSREFCRILIRLRVILRKNKRRF